MDLLQNFQKNTNNSVMKDTCKSGEQENRTLIGIFHRTRFPGERNKPTFAYSPSLKEEIRTPTPNGTKPST